MLGPIDNPTTYGAVMLLLVTIMFYGSSWIGIMLGLGSGIACCLAMPRLTLKRGIWTGILTSHIVSAFILGFFPFSTVLPSTERIIVVSVVCIAATIGVCAGLNLTAKRRQQGVEESSL